MTANATDPGLHSVRQRPSPPDEAFLPILYADLRRFASAAMAREDGGQTLQPTALVHEAWLRLARDADRRWVDRAHFFRAAAQTMRWILVDRARRRRSAKAGGDLEKTTFDGSGCASPVPDDRIIAVNQSLERLEAQDPESARVVTLKFFCGLSNREVAAVLGVSERSIERKWAYAKASLMDLLQRESGDSRP